MNSSKVLTEYPKIATPLTLLFSLLTVSWWLEVGLRIQFLAAIRFEFLLAGAAGAIAVFRSISSPKKPNENADILRCIVLFVGVLFISMPLAADFQSAWTVFVNRVVKYAIIGVLVSHYVISPLTLRVYLFASFIAFLKIGQEAFLGKITGSMVWENQGVPRLFGSPGTMFGHPNSLSGKVVSVLPFAWYLYPRMRSRWVKLLIVVHIIFSINVIIFTASRTGYLTVIAASMLLILFAERNKAKVLFATVALGIAAVTFVPPEYKERFVSAFTGQEKEGQSANTRKALFFDSVETFVRHPLGVGPHGFRIMQARAGRNAQDTHNLYTEILVETGIQGFICFAVLLVTVLKKGFRTRKRLRRLISSLKLKSQQLDPETRKMAQREIETDKFLLAATNSVLTFILVRLVLGVFGHDLFEIYWWLAAGLVMSLYSLTLVAEKRCTEITGETSQDLARNSRRTLQSRSTPSKRAREARIAALTADRRKQPGQRGRT